MAQPLAYSLWQPPRVGPKQQRRRRSAIVERRHQEPATAGSILRSRNRDKIQFEPIARQLAERPKLDARRPVQPTAPSDNNQYGQKKTSLANRASTTRPVRQGQYGQGQSNNQYGNQNQYGQGRSDSSNQQNQYSNQQPQFGNQQGYSGNQQGSYSNQQDQYGNRQNWNSTQPNQQGFANNQQQGYSQQGQYGNQQVPQWQTGQSSSNPNWQYNQPQSQNQGNQGYNGYTTQQNPNWQNQQGGTSQQAWTNQPNSGWQQQGFSNQSNSQSGRGYANSQQRSQFNDQDDVVHFQGHERAALGVTLAEHHSGAVLVSHVFPGSPAANAGLRQGDRITGVNQQPIRSYRDLIRVIGNSSPNSQVQLHVDRDGRSMTMAATLASPQSFEHASANRVPRIPRVTSNRDSIAAMDRTRITVDKFDQR